MNYQPAFMIINQDANGNYCLTVRKDGMVGLALYDPADPYQLWIKEENGTNDSQNQPKFTLRNVGTNEIIRGGDFTETYDSEKKSELWTVSRESDQGFFKIRTADNISRHMTPIYFRMHQGWTVSFWVGSKSCTQWKFAEPDDNYKIITISSRFKEGYNLTIRDGAVVLAEADSKDENQKWMTDSSYAKGARDQEDLLSFAIVNKATGQAISHGFGSRYMVQLAKLDKNYFDASLLWTYKANDESGFGDIRMQSQISTVFQAFYVDSTDSNKALLALRQRTLIVEQLWKFTRVNK
ncbi:Ricin B-like lectin R40G2 [Rhynchospora pubera]|nr:Ricin B-like lectin R40G2 [Rhynchospora pubera]